MVNGKPGRNRNKKILEIDFAKTASSYETKQILMSKMVITLVVKYNRCRMRKGISFGLPIGC